MFDVKKKVPILKWLSWGRYVHCTCAETYVICLFILSRFPIIKWKLVGLREGRKGSKKVFNFFFLPYFHYSYRQPPGQDHSLSKVEFSYDLILFLSRENVKNGLRLTVILNLPNVVKVWNVWFFSNTIITDITSQSRNSIISDFSYWILNYRGISLDISRIKMRWLQRNRYWCWITPWFSAFLQTHRSMNTFLKMTRLAFLWYLSIWISGCSSRAWS